MWLGQSGREERGAYLVTDSLQRWPVQSRQKVDKQLRIDLEVILDELAFFWVERKGGGGGFAGFDGAGEEVEGENLHFSGSLQVQVVDK